MPHYLITQPTQPDSWADHDGDGHVSVGELVVSLAVLAACIAFGLGVLAFAVHWFTRPAPGLLRLSSLILLLATVTAAALGIWRMTRYERAERQAHIDRARARRFEDEDRARTSGLTEQVKTARVTQADVDSAVWAMLRAYYKSGTLARGSVPGLSEVRWNLANKSLKSAGLRRGRAAALDADTLDEAWGRYIQWRDRSGSYFVTDDGELIVK